MTMPHHKHHKIPPLHIPPGRERWQGSRTRTPILVDPAGLTKPLLAELHHILIPDLPLPTTTMYAAALRRVEKYLFVSGLNLVDGPYPGDPRAREVGYHIWVADASLPVRQRREIRQYGDDQVITLLVDFNPKREGSASRSRFVLYQTGMSVATYISAVGDKFRAMADLRYDTQHLYIRVDTAPLGG